MATNGNPPDDDDDVDAPMAFGDGAWDHDPADVNAPEPRGSTAAPWADRDPFADDGAYTADDDRFDSRTSNASTAPGEYASATTMPNTDPYGREARELGRRMQAQRTPAFPIDLQKHLPMEAVWQRWRKLAMFGRSDVVDDFGRDPKATARWEPFFEFLYSKWFRVSTSGVENVPSTGRALLIANHSGTLPYDSAMVMHAVRRDHPARRDVRPLIEDAVFHLPFLGPMMNRVGGVRACPENAERLLAKNELVAVFPEGVKGMSKLWRDRYRLQRFGRGGFVKLALRTRAPIIPVAVVGAEEAMPMLAKITWFAGSVDIPWVPVTPTFPALGPIGLMPLPSKWMVRFGKPVDVAAEYGPEAADDRLLVNRLADQIRATIQDMVDDLRARRGRPFL